MANKKNKKTQYNKPPIEKKNIKDISPEAKRRAVMITANTVLLSVIYFGSMALPQLMLSMIVTIGYCSAFASLLIAYVIYNRGFTRKNVTEDMLPDSWNKEKKQQYIEDGKKRYDDSKWMLTVIIPIMIPIALELISLCTWPMIQNLLGLK